MIQSQQNVHPVSTYCSSFVSRPITFSLLIFFLYPLNWPFPAALLSNRPPLPHPIPLAQGYLAATARLVSVNCVACMPLVTFRSRPSAFLVATYICYVAQGVWDHLYLAPGHWALGVGRRSVLQLDKAGVCVMPEFVCFLKKKNMETNNIFDYGNTKYFCLLHGPENVTVLSVLNWKIYAPSRVLLSPALSPTCALRPLFMMTPVFTARATVQEP